MAFESIVLALTEDGRYQRVQLYVAGSDDDIPQRIPLYWFDRSRATDIERDAGRVRKGRTGDV